MIEITPELMSLIEKLDFEERLQLCVFLVSQTKQFITEEKVLIWNRGFEPLTMFIEGKIDSKECYKICNSMIHTKSTLAYPVEIPKGHNKGSYSDALVALMHSLKATRVDKSLSETILVLVYAVSAFKGAKKKSEFMCMVEKHITSHILRDNND